MPCQSPASKSSFIVSAILNERKGFSQILQEKTNKTNKTKQIKQNETKWNKMKQNETKWNESKWKEKKKKRKRTERANKSCRASDLSFFVFINLNRKEWCSLNGPGMNYCRTTLWHQLGRLFKQSLPPRRWMCRPGQRLQVYLPHRLYRISMRGNIRAQPENETRMNK